MLANGSARLKEIAENLHRADVTTLQRNEQIAEWIRLTEAQSVERVLAQIEPKPRGGRPAAGVRAASRELGIDRNEAQRALKIAGITPAAKEAAKAAGLQNINVRFSKSALASTDSHYEFENTMRSSIYPSSPPISKSHRGPFGCGKRLYVYPTGTAYFQIDGSSKMDWLLQQAPWLNESTAQIVVSGSAALGFFAGWTVKSITLRVSSRDSVRQTQKSWKNSTNTQVGRDYSQK